MLYLVAEDYDADVIYKHISFPYPISSDLDRLIASCLH